MLKFLDNLLGKKEQKEEDRRQVVPQQSGDVGQEEVTPWTKASLNGTVAVSDGKVQVTSPQEGGIPARIGPGKGVKLLINGQEIKGSAPVLAEDEIEIIIVNKEIVRKLEVEVPAQKMEAYLIVRLEKGIQSTLLEQKVAPKMLVEAQVAELKPEPITMEEAEKALQEAGVVYGIKRESLKEALEAIPGKLTLVAQGKPFVAGKDAFIEYMFAADEKKLVSSVEEGELVAVKHPAEPGVAGMNVLGQVLTPPPVKDCALKVEKGLVLEEDGLQAVASQSGRLVVGRNGLYIDPVYTSTKDLTLENSPFIFKGHLVIGGSISEGVKVETLGNLEVQGGALQAEILAGGGVVVQKSIIGTQVSAGRFKWTYESLVAKLNQLNFQTKELLDSAVQMRGKTPAGTTKAVTEEKIIRVLFSSRFPDFFALLKKFSEELKTIEKYLAKDLQEKLQRISAYQKNPPEKISDLPKLYQDIKNAIKSLGNYFADAAGDLLVYYVQNSTIEASGNIYVQGIGCYNSILTSKGQVIVEGQRGLVRGGKIIAGDKVIVKELGCPSGAPTYVEVPEDKKIEAALIYPGVILKVGSRVYRNDQKSKNFDMYLDEEENLQVTKLKAE